MAISLPNLHPLQIRLDRTNYAFWRVQILSTVRAHCLDDLLDKAPQIPIQFLPNSRDQAINPEFVTWKRRDQYLVSWMLSSIGESMLGYVTRCATASQIWHVLEDLFQSQSKARIMQLSLQLQTQKKGDLSVDEYFLKMRGFADMLAAAGKVISDDELVLHILGGFGPEYEAVVVNLTHRPDNPTLQEVQFILQAYEVRLQNMLTQSFPSAHVAFKGSQNVASRGGNARFRGGRSGSGGSRSVVCQLCGRSGHVALKCFKRFDINFTGNTSAPQAFLSASSSETL